MNTVQFDWLHDQTLDIFQIKVNWDDQASLGINPIILMIPNSHFYRLNALLSSLSY